MMPRQVYRCPQHGEFEVAVSIDADVPEAMPCPIEDFPCRKCGESSDWVPSAPNFIGGPTTGAQKE